MEKKPKKHTIEAQKELFHEKGSKLEKYQKLIIGTKSLLYLIKFEIITLMSSWVPGALGLFLRSKLYPFILGKCGKGVTFGQNVTLRHPQKIKIGDNVVIDDNCMLDAKGTDNEGITIGNNVFIGRNTILSCKNGDIILKNNVNIGFNSYIFSANKVEIGEYGLIAAYCYLIGGNHDYDDSDKPILEQGRTSYGITLEENIWFGAGVKVQDGVTIGKNSIIGTSAVVTKDIPPYSIAAGIPARVIKKRKKEEKEENI